MKIIECPRDAMQGLHDFIPTEVKTRYLSQLLKVGFHTIDFGSFVSPKAIPQMRDTAAVLQSLDLTDTTSKLLAIVANLRGAQHAANWQTIDYLGFPLSLSETFQQRNTNRSIAEALQILAAIHEVCQKHNMKLVTYLSMGFGNPYGDPYDRETVLAFVEQLVNMEIEIISLADTIGISNRENITYLFETLVPAFPEVEFGAHLHSHPREAREKLHAAYLAGCRRFDGALRGYGGCPMAEDDLVGNMATELIIRHLIDQGEELELDQQALKEALNMVSGVFPA
ncbi:MAG: hydroxymethylglutaryl-CoA lyase [Cyclobacteriaceae bacterium]|nr:hydroxymethylglutaryl-CoA lyase [Cyclobacteriaceae bacterium]